MKRIKGYSLINLLITLAIASILICISTSSLGALVQQIETKQTAKELFRLINYSRLQAVNTREKVILCPSIDNESCINDWSANIIVFADKNNDQQYQEEWDTLLTKDQLADNRLSINWRSFGSRPYIRFDELGTTGYQNGRIYICDESQSHKAQLIIYRSGRTRYALDDHLRNECG